MIRYRLVCACGHNFEEWFSRISAYDEQKESGALSCPACGGSDVRKAIMAPAVGGGADPQPCADYCPSSAAGCCSGCGG